jgi:hypothetical protein
MTSTISAQDVMHDIEVELLQGAVTSDDLGQSVQRVRRFQNQVRGETLDSRDRPDYRAIANRQFQINDMVLTLAQETATRQRALEMALHKALRRGLLPPGGEQSASTAGLDGDAYLVDADQSAALPPPPADALVRRLEAIQSAMDEDALLLQLEVTPTETPVVGRALGSARAALHSLVVFYANRLAAKQAPINRLYGESLQELYQVSERQQETIAALQEQLATLQAQLAAQRPQTDQ